MIFSQIFFRGKEGIYAVDLEVKEDNLPTEPQGRPFWQVQVEYSNHTVQNISSYEEYLPDRPEELYLSLLEYFESEDEIFWERNIATPKLIQWKTAEMPENKAFHGFCGCGYLPFWSAASLHGLFCPAILHLFLTIASNR